LMALVTTTLIFNHQPCHEAGKGLSSMLFQVQRGKPLTGVMQVFKRLQALPGRKPERYSDYCAAATFPGCVLPVTLNVFRYWFHQLSSRDASRHPDRSMKQILT